MMRNEKGMVGNQIISMISIVRDTKSVIITQKLWKPNLES